MKVSSFLRLIRFPNVFTAVSNIFAAYLLSVSHVNFTHLVLLIVISAFLYSAGMIFNDLADREYDRKFNPGRPLIRGDVSLNQALVMAISLMFTANIFSLLISVRTFIFAIILSLMILSYDFLLKKHHWTASAGMGACRFLNWMLGMSAGIILIAYPFFWLIYIAILTFLARYENIKPYYKKYVILLLVLIPVIDGLILILNFFYWQGIAVAALIIPVILLKKYFYMT